MASSSSSSSRGYDESSASVKIQAAPRDSCTWYADAQCTKPRSCSDCLNVPLANGSHCAIHPSGACVSLTQYAWRLDYRRTAATVLTSYYPSTNTTYCSQTEPGCTDCRRLAIVGFDGLYGYALPTGPVAQCTGRDGCVCVAACEASEWRGDVLAREKCASHEYPTVRVFGFHTSKIAYVLLSISVVGLIVLLVLVRKWWIRHRQAVRHRLRFATLRLGLEGWYALRKKLIDDEHAELGLQPMELKVPCNGNGDTNAENGPLALEIGAGLQVEHGAGYRPVSPSEYEHQRSRRLGPQEEPHATAA